MQLELAARANWLASAPPIASAGAPRVSVPLPPLVAVTEEVIVEPISWLPKASGLGAALIVSAPVAGSLAPMFQGVAPDGRGFPEKSVSMAGTVAPNAV